MEKKIRKLFLDHEKKEKWINEMATQGLDLTEINNTIYTFKKTDIKYTYKIELLEHQPNHPESIKHINNTKKQYNVEISCIDGCWVYFKSEYPFELFNTSEEKINHHSRISKIWTKIMFLIPAFVTYITIQNMLISKYLNTPYKFDIYVFCLALAFMVSIFAYKKRNSIYKKINMLKITL